MDANELAKAVRSGDEKLRADDLVLDTGSKKLTGKGYLHVQPAALTIYMTLDAEGDHPEEGSPRVATKSDFWKMTGIIERELVFRCNFPPVPTMHFHNGLVTVEATVNPIEVEANAWNLLTLEERKEKWKQFQTAFGIPATDIDFEANETEKLADGSFEFRADFVDHELRFKPEATHIERKNPFFGKESSSWNYDTLTGETSTYKFAFIQDDRNNDLRLVMRSKEDQPPLSEAEHLQKYETLSEAIAFVHGINAWPYRLQYWRAGSKAYDRLSAARPAPRTGHTPFSGLRHGVDMAGFLPKVAEFLEPATPFNNDLRTMMYLFRQAGAEGVHGKIGSLALCSLLESLTTVLFIHFGLKAPPPATFADFGARRADVLTYIDGLADPNDSTLRLRDCVSSAQPTKRLKVEQKFEMVCHHLGLPWDGKMKLVKEAWEQLRNNLAHGDFREGESITEQIYKADTLAKSRIAGGFNTVLLKLFGYNGSYNSSVFEPGFDTM